MPLILSPLLRPTIRSPRLAGQLERSSSRQTERTSAGIESARLAASFIFLPSAAITVAVPSAPVVTGSLPPLTVTPSAGALAHVTSNVVGSVVQEC